MQYTSIFVAGHNGMVGASIVRCLKQYGYSENAILTQNRQELDLRDRESVFQFLSKNRPEAVVVAAAKVGGIWANQSHPAAFMYDNLAIAQNVIHTAWEVGVKRLIFLGSSCIYPRDCPQPIKESYLLQGPLEKTNEAYALAKIAGLKLCEYYRKEHGVQFHSLMPTNLYGPGDYYHITYAHVIPALILKFHEAKIKNLPQVVLWGSGQPRREFLHVDDLASAILKILHLEQIKEDWLNVGTGVDQTIAELAGMIQSIVGFSGEVVYDKTKPDGTPQKLLDISKIKSLGWYPIISLEAGLRDIYALFLKESAAGTLRS